jgi:hypothetical protein
MMAMKYFLYLTLCISFLFCACKRKNGSAGSSPLAGKYCDCLEATKKLPDSVRIDSCDWKVLADTLDTIGSDSMADVFLQTIHTQLEKNCKNYKALLDSMAIIEDWTEADTGKASYLSAQECDEFTKFRELYYQESNKDTTYVTLVDGIWTETMKGGKYTSKLQFSWTGDCSFELSFISSNDPVKSKMSKKGEKYRYRLMDKYNGYYLVIGIVKKSALQFRMFY